MVETDGSAVRLPDFFIVGAARSGTTSMHQYLRRHPHIFLPGDLDKEPGYYSNLTGVSDRQTYLDLFRGADSRYTRVGEASTAYLTDPDAADRIHSDVPEARVIILLRNPADRAYSLYNWMTAEGYEWMSTFEKALDAEPGRAQSRRFRAHCPQYLHNYYYFSSGLYESQVARFYRRFGRDRVLVLLFEEFVSDTGGSVRKVCRFLNLTPPEAAVYEMHNASRRALSPPVQVALRQLTDRAVMWGLNRANSKSKRDRLLSLGLGRTAPRSMSVATRTGLLARYREDITRLQDLLERDLSLWLDPGAPQS